MQPGGGRGRLMEERRGMANRGDGGVRDWSVMESGGYGMAKRGVRAR